MFVTLVLINERFGLVPLRRARYLLILWFPFMMLFAYGLTAISRWSIVSGIVVIIWSISGWTMYRDPLFLEHIGTIDAVQYYPPMHDYVVELKDIGTNLMIMLSGLQGRILSIIRVSMVKAQQIIIWRHSLAEMVCLFRNTLMPKRLVGDMPKKLANNPYLLFTYNPQDMPENFDLAQAPIWNEEYIACDVVIDKPTLYVQRYIYHTLTCDRDYAPIVYDNGVTIVDKYADYDPQTHTVRIVTGFEVADEKLLYEYNVSLQIITSDWQNVGQIDRHLHDDLLKWYVAELSTDGLAPGDYRVMVVVYETAAGKGVNGTDSMTGESGTILPITVFTIEE